MVQVIRRDPTSAELTGEALGQGLREGLSGALQSYQRQKQQTLTAQALGSMAGFDKNKTKLLGMLPTEMQQFVVQHVAARNKQRAGLGKAVKTQFGFHPDEDFSGENYERVKDRAEQYFEEGYDETQASELAYRDIFPREEFGQQQTPLQQQLTPSSQMQSGKPGTAEAKRIAPLTGDVFKSSDQFGIGGFRGKELVEDLKKTGLKVARPWINLAQEMGAKDVLHPGRKQPLEQFDILTQGQGVPQGTAQQILSAYPFGPEGLAFEYGAEALKGAPEPIRMAAGFIAAVGAHKAQNSPVFKATNKILTDAEKIAQKNKTSVENVIAEAQQRSGADLQKAASGNVSEINKLRNAVSKEVPEIGKRVAEIPKETFKPEKEIARREKTAEQLKSEKTPLEEYYKKEKPTEHRAPTKVKHEEIRARVQPQIVTKNKELFDAQKHIRDLKAERRGSTPEAVEKINGTIKYYEDVQMPRIRQQLDELKYELRNFEKPKSLEEIRTEVTKSGQNLIEEAKNPTAEGQKKIQDQLAKDKDFIEKAAKIADRGVIPGNIKPDTFIKMKQAYLDGYNALIGELRDEIRGLKGARDTETLKKIADRRQGIRNLEARAVRLKADIQNQTDKLKTKEALEKPSGAFYKQLLKGTKGDIEAFQKDYFRQHKHLIAPEERKTAQAAQKEIQKIAQEAQKKPTLEKLEKLAEEAGVPKEEVKKAVEETKKIVGEGKPLNETVKEVGKSWEKIGEKTETGLRKKTGSAKLANKLARRIFGVTGITYAISYLLSGGESLTPAQVFKEFKHSKEVEKYRRALATNDQEKIRRIRQEFIVKGYSAAKINNIAKSARAKQRLEKE